GGVSRGGRGVPGAPAGGGRGPPGRRPGPAARRLTGPPRPVAGELVRDRLVDALAGRWDVPVTAVLAGPGFGKSTALGQAMRLHDADPRGVEAWLGCEPGDEDAYRLADRMCRALGGRPGAAGPPPDGPEAAAATSPR